MHTTRPLWSRYLRAMPLIGLFSSAILTSACALERADLLEQGAVQLQAEPSQSFTISNVQVLADLDTNETTVYGKVRRLGIYYNAFSSGRVVTRAILPDGTIIERTDNILVPTHRVRNFRAIYPEANFKIRFDQVLPQQTILQLTFVS